MRAELSQAISLSQPFRLCWGRVPLWGNPGTREGRQVGSSVEFHDYRSYVPGDDVRTVDWKAYARTESLTVRLFREEVAPQVDLLIDETASMATEAAKRTRLEQLCVFFSSLAGKDHAQLRISSRIPAEPVTDPLGLKLSFRPQQEPFPPQALRQCRLRSVRVVLSDFLFPHDPFRLLGQCARGAGRLFLIMLNTPQELEPTFRGPHLLIDVENGTRLELDISEAASERYKSRLADLIAGLRREALRVRALFVRLRTDLPFEDTVSELLASGMVEAL